MTLGGTVMVVTAALVVAGGASCLSLLNNNVKSPEAIGGGQSVVYKTESASELKSNKWETAETAFAALADSDLGGRAAAGGGAYRVASLQINEQRAAARPANTDRKSFPLYRFTDDSSVLTIDHAPRETNSFPMRSAQKLAYATERNSALDQGRLENALRAQQIRPQSLPVKEPLTKLVEFDAAPFPYDGGRRSYHDNRVLLHIPKGFDARRPGVMVLFFHGHRATLERDVRDRQQVPAQISASGMNAVLGTAVRGRCRRLERRPLFATRRRRPLRYGSSRQTGAAARRSAHRQDVRKHANYHCGLQRRVHADRLLLVQRRPRQESRARRSSAGRRLWPARQVCDLD
jgi:hypothetical protein